jgi:histone acetyltransferase (RNA polymerase elongator complex component)
MENGNLKLGVTMVEVGVQSITFISQTKELAGAGYPYGKHPNNL